jgi:FG-GAP-like repeat
MFRRVPRLGLRTVPRNIRRLRVEGLEDRTVPSFTVAPSFPVGPNNGLNTKPVSVATGDFNGDGRVDVATANTDGHYVSVLFGNGDGTFGSSTNIDIGRTPNFVRALDVNGDGDLDLVTANKTDNSVSVLISNGNGAFSLAGTFATGAATGPVALDGGDLNGDGALDLAVADSGASTVSVLLGDGDGNFTSSGAVNVTSAPTSVALADLNGDHKPDIATVSGGSGNLNVNLNAGNGMFAPPANFATGFCANAVTAGDFNRDGKADLAVGCIFPSSDGVSVLIGKGDGTFVTHLDQFGNPIPFVSYNAGNQTPGGITVADLNGDGIQDLVTANFSSTIEFANNSVSVLPGNPDGTFGPARVYHGGQGPVAVAVGDVNGDGNLDLVTADEGGTVGTISVLAGRGDGTLRASEALPVTVRNAASFNGVVAGDFTGDGIADLAVATWNVNYNGVTLFPSLGDGEFAAGIPTASISNVTGMASGDFNGDHKLDLAVAGQDGVTILLGNGDGTFAAGSALPAGTSPQWVTVADFNNDHNLDLAVANNSGAVGVSLLLGNGNGTFQSAQSVTTGQANFYVATADLNQDGKADLAVVGSSGVSVVFGNGNGAFGSPASFNAGGGPGGVALSDLNGDGFPDVVVPSFIPPGGGGSAVLVRLNDGTGHFPTQNQYPTDAFGSNPIGCAIVDVNGDSIPDIVAVNDFSDTVSFFSGTGDGTFSPQTTAVVGDRPTWVTTGDFNNDGRPDLAVVNSNSGSVSVLTRPAPATHFDVAADPGLATAGNSFHVTVTAKDADGHFDPDFRGTVTFGTDDGSPTLPDPYQFTAADAGTHTFDVTLRTAGQRDLSITGPLGTVHLSKTVDPAAADHYQFDVPAAGTAGAPFDIAFTAMDPYENVATGYTGTLHFQTNDLYPAATVPADFTFTAADAGTHMFATGVDLFTAGARTLTVTPSDLTGQTASLTLDPAAASRLTLSPPGTAVAGTAVPVLVSAWDPYGNAATGFNGTVHLETTDPIAALPADYTFITGDQGSHTFQVTFKRAGAQSLSVATAGLSGDQKNGIQVNPTSASQVAFIGSPTNTFVRTAEPLPAVVQLEDPFGNPVSQSVPVSLSLGLNPGTAVLKNATAFTDFTGRATFPRLMLTKPGVGYTLVAHSSSGDSLASDPFTVYAATHFKLTLTSTKATAGSPFTATLSVLDAHNHPDTTYRGTVHFTSTSATASLPADYTFTSADQGVHSFPVTLDQAGIRLLTVADTAKTTVKKRSALTVGAGTATQFAVTKFPLTAKANTLYAFIVTALDQFGNRATGYLGSVTISSNGSVTIVGAGPTAPAPATYTFTARDKGRHVFKAKFTAPGTGLSLTVTDQANAIVTGTETGITVG